MKKMYVAALAVVSACSMAATAQENNFTIKGTVTDMTTGKLYLRHQQGDSTYLDSTLIADGRYSFSGRVSEPWQYNLYLAGERTAKLLFIEPGIITIEADKNWENAKVTGSAQQPVLDQFNREWTKVHNMAGGIYQRLDKATREKDTVAMTAAREDLDNLEPLADSLFGGVIAAHPGSPVAPWIIYQRYIVYPAPAKVDSFYKMLTPAAQQSAYGKQVADYLAIYSRTGVGARPSFALPDTAGKTVQLKDYHGHYVLVDFWASWCVPCRKENPNVLAAYEAYHDKGFDVLGVSLDDKKERWLNAIHADGLPWQHVSDLNGWKGKLIKEYGITAIPTNFLLDPSGKVVARDLRGEALQRKLAALLQ